MKRMIKILTTLWICFLVTNVSAQGITGLWYNNVKDAKIEIYKARNGKYYGKIVWLKFPERDGKPKLDIQNDDETMRTRPIMGLVILTGFVKDGKIYDDGNIYDPKSGNTYSCKITPEGSDKLHIRGYTGISLIGRTTIWTRVTQ